MLFDRQQELMSGEAAGCHGDGAAQQGSLGSRRLLHHPGLQSLAQRESLCCSR